jgi:proteasome lid subunit RPN8/RPN11
MSRLNVTMGMLWRLLAPRPVKRIRRAVTNPLSYVTPRPVKQVRRAAFNVTHPWEVVERAAENAIVAGVRGQPRRRPTTRKSRRAMAEVRYEGSFAIPAAVLDLVAEHARASYPLLCCGVIGRGDQGIRVYRGSNSSASPRDSWEMSPSEAARLLDAVGGRDPLAVYHSFGPEMARNPSYITERPGRAPILICFVTDPPEFRAFQTVSSRLAELRIEIVKEAAPH